MSVFDCDSLTSSLFLTFDEKEYLDKNNIHLLFNANKLELQEQLTKKPKKTLYQNVDPNNNTPFTMEIDDLIRLHFLIQSRKVLTIMEFGTGKSSSVLADALLKNKKKYFEHVNKIIRRHHAFELHCIDDDEKWLINTQENFNDGLKDVTHFHYCPTETSHFNNRLCTYYIGIPNICPDFIYLDGPSQFSPEGSLRGLHTHDIDRMPMAADILVFEHFLAPGTLIVIDGRTANARFLYCNLQRNWAYQYSPSADQHYFELQEKPLGLYNKKHLEFALNPNWLK